VLPTFWKKPALIAVPLVLMNWISSRSSVRNTAALARSVVPSVRRSPSSTVRETTFFSAGSARKMFGSRHGAAGSAHVSSTGVGARIPSL